MDTQCLTADPEELSTGSMYRTALVVSSPMADTSVAEDHFATTPMIAVQPVSQQPNEEELHTSFEQAISARLIPVHRQLKMISGPLTNTQSLQPSTEPLLDSGLINYSVQRTSAMQLHGAMPRLSLPGNVLQSTIILSCFALILILMGFDLMGMLLLYIH